MENTLRETIESAVTEVEAKDAPATQTTVGADAPAQPAAQEIAGETEQQKADRLRDEKGRFVAGETDKTEKKEQVLAPAQVPVQAQPEVKPLPRPSSWEKGMWPIWDKLNTGAPLDAKEARQLAEYSNKREGDYANGVSTYKREWDSAKPVLDALTPFRDVIQQTGLQPAQWINELGTAHRLLTQGSPEQKLGVFTQIALNNGIDLQKFAEKVFVRGQDGQIYFNQQLMQQAQQRQQPAQQPQDVEQTVQKILAQERAQQSLAEFSSNKEKYPHYEAVRQQMGQLLDAGLAQDLPDAYTKALRMDDNLWQAEQEAKRKADETAKLEAQRKATAAAKANAVSTKSATPAGPTAGTNKGLRAQIAEAVDQHTGGRV